MAHAAVAAQPSMMLTSQEPQTRPNRLFAFGGWACLAAVRACSDPFTVEARRPQGRGSGNLGSPGGDGAGRASRSGVVQYDDQAPVPRSSICEAGRAPGEVGACPSWRRLVVVAGDRGGHGAEGDAFHFVRDAAEKLSQAVDRSAGLVGHGVQNRGDS
jgi:hypothetical protein